MKCRSCNDVCNKIFLNLIGSPPSNAFLSEDDLSKPEAYFPLIIYVCDSCLLVQIEDVVLSKGIFNAGYVYFSSYSEEFVQHAKNYVSYITSFLELNHNSMVYEAASNDGYLLQFFYESGIPCCGIEPSKSVAEVSVGKGIETKIEFFTAELASRLVNDKGNADLFIGNNVLAHVPHLNDFVTGIGIILKKNGIATLEFPHLLHLINNNEFDTIYHEHYSYFSLHALIPLFTRHGLSIFNVEVLPIHGGSLRVYICKNTKLHPINSHVDEVLLIEKESGINDINCYKGFQEKFDTLCSNFISFLLEKYKEGSKIAGYGAAAKANTLLNYCGIKPYLIPFICDVTPAKQGKYLPGSHIPVLSEEILNEYKPDYIIIFPWNWKKSIIKRLSYCRSWDAKFVTIIPKITIY